LFALLGIPVLDPVSRSARGDMLSSLAGPSARAVAGARRIPRRAAELCARLQRGSSAAPCFWAQKNHWCEGEGI